MKQEEEEVSFSERLQLTKTQKEAAKEADPMYSLIEYDENMAIAYLVRKMPETFANSLRVLMEIKYRFPEEKVTNLLDFGAGLGSMGVSSIGSFGMAFSDTFPSAEFIVNVEPADSMRRLGKYISQEFNNFVWVPALSDTLRFDQHKIYDVVSISNVLEEMPTPERMPH